jgi:hypothetical protein
LYNTSPYATVIPEPTVEEKTRSPRCKALTIKEIIFPSLERGDEEVNASTIFIATLLLFCGLAIGISVFGGSFFKKFD